jgi:hypothetical protein
MLWRTKANGRDKSAGDAIEYDRLEKSALEHLRELEEMASNARRSKDGGVHYTRVRKCVISGGKATLIRTP